jgi:hypothetical protein
MDCHNYRGKSLLNIAYKVLSGILFKRISLPAEKVIGSYQCGFPKNRPTVERIVKQKNLESLE